MDLRKIFKYYWPHIRQYKWSTFIVLTGYGIALIGSDIISPLLYKRIMDVVSSGQEPSAIGASLLYTVLMLGLMLFLSNVFFRIADYAITYSQSNILKRIADDAFERVQHHSYGFFSSTFTGSLVAKVRRYINAFETIHDNFIFNVWMNGLSLLFSFLVLSYFSLILGSILLVWLLLYTAITIVFVRIKIKKDLHSAEANSEVTGVLSDTITNMFNIKMFASQKRELTNFATATAEEERRRRKAWNFQNIQFLFQGFFIALFEFSGMFAAVYLWIQGSISAGTIILVQIYALSIFGIVWNIGRNISRTMTAFAEAQEMVDIFEEPISVQDPVNPEPVRIQAGKIEMKDISFSYNGETRVFEKFNLTINPGEKVAFVGRSGAGKTTITKLLLRFADIETGSITIDGQDITHITQNDVRLRIAYVPQDPILFHRTIKENIAYGKPDASDEEIRAAAESAHAHEFIEKLPATYDTFVGERGIKLSGGEKQRVAIARAMLKNAPILILDEATSSLDSISENYIQDGFNKLMEGRTTIVIAHRLSTIRRMDRIIVLEEGRVVEAGSHDELIAKSGFYAELWQSQIGGFLAE